jgi:hypothetical protein
LHNGLIDNSIRKFFIHEYLYIRRPFHMNKNEFRAALPFLPSSALAASIMNMRPW